MKMRLVIPALALAIAMPLQGQAQTQAPGRHPAYLHALTDLHDARWYLEHRPGGPMEEREFRAIGEIDRAIEEVQRAAYYDGKNVYEHPRDDTYPDAAGRLRRVSDLLRKARDDVAQEEDNLSIRDVQYRAVQHIDNAIRIAESIMVDRERMRGYDHEHDHGY